MDLSGSLEQNEFNTKIIKQELIETENSTLTLSDKIDEYEGVSVTDQVDENGYNNYVEHGTDSSLLSTKTESYFGPFNAVFINDSLSRNTIRGRDGAPKRTISIYRLACHYCGKSFGDNSQLRKHIRTHTGERPFLCSYCGKRFGRRSILQAHTRTHTGEHPYKCRYCDKRFKSTCSRSMHTKTHKLEIKSTR